MTDQTLATATDETPSQLQHQSLADAAVASKLQTVLDLDEILSSARSAERSVPICTDGPLVREYAETMAQLAELVDTDGNVLEQDGEAAVGDISAAEDLNARGHDLRRRMKASTYAFRFRAMNSDEWGEFDKAHRDSQNKVKNPRRYTNELISKCAVSPEISIEGVEKLRAKLNNAQIVELFNAAFTVNNSDGIDVPFSPSFLRAPKPKEQ